jgi:hypothetical protein
MISATYNSHHLVATKLLLVSHFEVLSELNSIDSSSETVNYFFNHHNNKYLTPTHE